MPKVTLVARSDNYDSEPGLAIRGVNWDTEDFMADRNGSLIAHDVLEHVNGPGQIGTVWDDLCRTSDR